MEIEGNKTMAMQTRAPSVSQRCSGAVVLRWFRSSATIAATTTTSHEALRSSSIMRHVGYSAVQFSKLGMIFLFMMLLQVLTGITYARTSP